MNDPNTQTPQPAPIKEVASASATQPPDPVQSPPETPEETVTPPPKKKLPRSVFVVGGVLALFILISALLYASSLNKEQEPNAPEPTPLVRITPTPIRKLTQIATTSAFAVFHASVASLSGDIHGFVLQDSTLTPPILEVNLEL